ncbi:MAG: hypothetical protein IJV06_01365 [Bacteroidaceae bacterium]|nr:hypothetical protein [Bacteroidaceae bacterium]
MKKTLFLTIVGLICSIGTWAQKTQTQVQYQSTQALILDVSPKSYVKPLTVELKVKSGRIRDIVKIPKNIAFVGMNGNTENWRSYAVYEVSKRKDCDVIVAPTFNIKYDEVAGDQEVQVEVVGYPADFTNWQTATKTDLEWVNSDKTLTTADRDKIGAAVKAPTK